MKAHQAYAMKGNSTLRLQGKGCPPERPVTEEEETVVLAEINRQKPAMSGQILNA